MWLGSHQVSPPAYSGLAAEPHRGSKAAHPGITDKRQVGIDLPSPVMALSLLGSVPLRTVSCASFSSRRSMAWISLDTVRWSWPQASCQWLESSPGRNRRDRFCPEDTKETPLYREDGAEAQSPRAREGRARG